MQLSELPEMAKLLRVHVIVDASPAPHVEPNPELLQQLTDRKSRTGKRQSEHSKKRQAFFIEMGRYWTPEELRARAEYLEEWRIRMSENFYAD